ncbi:MAG: hypothetical protein NVS4B3_17830 [Gemmatimonadaceae bacterium]
MSSPTIMTYVYYIAEKVVGGQDMERFAHPIHVGIVSAPDHEAAYTAVLENLRPTFASEPQPLELRFEVLTPPRGGTGVWRHGKPIDTDITFTSAD